MPLPFPRAASLSNFRRALVLSAAMLIAPMTASAQIGFEDVLPLSGFDAGLRGVRDPLPDYAGLHWFGFGLVYTPYFTPTTSGYNTLAAFTASNTVAFGQARVNQQSVTVLPEITAINGGVFNFLGMSVTGVWRNMMTLTIKAYDVNDQEMTGGGLSYFIGQTAQTLSPNLTGVKRVTFSTSGGVVVSENELENGLQFAVDNIVQTRVSTVPEPTSVALFAIGLSGLGLAARHRRRK